MKGLEILVTNSDLVLKQEERLIKLFVMFKDNKYGTKYVIFTDSNGKELFFGNPLVNGKKMVIMKFKAIKDAEMVKEYVWKFLNGESISGFETIEIPNIEKLEIIDYNNLDVKEEYIQKLIDIYFKNVEVVEEKNVVDVPKKKSKVPLLITFVLLIFGVLGYLYLRNNPELIYGKNIYIECKINYDETKFDASVKEIVTLTFNNSQKLRKHEKDLTYIFDNSDEYYNFKEKNLQYQYISESGMEKFVDEELSYKLFVDYNLGGDYKLPSGYDELFEYYVNLNYSCNNIEK